MGAGKAIISTPCWYAAEVLEQGRGMLVPFENPAAIATSTIALLANDEAREAMRERAYLYARHMVWKRVAQSYLAAFLRARTNCTESVHMRFAVQQQQPTLSCATQFWFAHPAKPTDRDDQTERWVRFQANPVHRH
jgi:hypothetical protein